MSDESDSPTTLDHLFNMLGALAKVGQQRAEAKAQLDAAKPRRKLKAKVAAPRVKGAMSSPSFASASDDSACCIKKRDGQE